MAVTVEKLKNVKREAERVIRCIRDVAVVHGDEIPMNGSKQTAALRRASMDLTRALAEMRDYR